MRVKFQSSEYRWLAVRERPDKGSPMVRRIETGTEFDVSPERNDGWLLTEDDPKGYVMEDFVEQVDATGDALSSMTVADLRKLAKDSGIPLKSGMGKIAIIEAILNG